MKKKLLKIVNLFLNKIKPRHVYVTMWLGFACIFLYLMEAPKTGTDLILNLLGAIVLGFYSVFFFIPFIYMGLAFGKFLEDKIR